MNVTRLDAHLAAFGVDDTGAIGANKTGLRLGLQRVADLNQNLPRQRLLRGQGGGF